MINRGFGLAVDQYTQEVPLFGSNLKTDPIRPAPSFSGLALRCVVRFDAIAGGTCGNEFGCSEGDVPLKETIGMNCIGVIRSFHFSFPYRTSKRIPGSTVGTVGSLPESVVRCWPNVCKPARVKHLGSRGAGQDLKCSPPKVRISTTKDTPT